MWNVIFLVSCNICKVWNSLYQMICSSLCFMKTILFITYVWGNFLIFTLWHITLLKSDNKNVYSMIPFCVQPNLQTYLRWVSSCASSIPNYNANILQLLLWKVMPRTFDRHLTQNFLKGVGVGGIKECSVLCLVCHMH